MLRRKTLTSQVIDYIVGLIKNGDVKPGERLPTEIELTQTLGVSRTCVREAMKSPLAIQGAGADQKDDLNDLGVIADAFDLAHRQIGITNGHQN